MELQGYEKALSPEDLEIRRTQQLKYLDRWITQDGSSFKDKIEKFNIVEEKDQLKKNKKHSIRDKANCLIHPDECFRPVGVNEWGQETWRFSFLLKEAI